MGGLDYQKNVKNDLSKKQDSHSTERALFFSSLNYYKHKPTNLLFWSKSIAQVVSRFWCIAYFTTPI
jgi:hypothetical protein